MNRYVFTPGFAIAALAVLWILTWGAPLAQEGQRHVSHRQDRQGVVGSVLAHSELQRSTVKLLGEGEAPKNLTVKVNRISAGARQKVEAAGGTVELV